MHRSDHELVTFPHLNRAQISGMKKFALFAFGLVAYAAAFSPSGVALRRPFGQCIRSTALLRTGRARISVSPLCMADKDDEDAPILFNANDGDPRPRCDAVIARQA
jgi:hypothetical protein